MRDGVINTTTCKSKSHKTEVKIPKLICYFLVALTTIFEKLKMLKEAMRVTIKINLQKSIKFFKINLLWQVFELTFKRVLYTKPMCKHEYKAVKRKF